MQQEFRYELAILQDRFLTVLAWNISGFKSFKLYVIFPQENCFPLSNLTMLYLETFANRDVVDIMNLLSIIHLVCQPPSYHRR
jgi:hypothetical protein